MQDESGSIQLYCDKARMGDAAFEAVKSSFDVGDIIGATGPVKRTEKGELSIVATELSLLTKSLLPLPDKFHGLTDVEKRYRQRYVDMLTRPEARRALGSRLASAWMPPPARRRYVAARPPLRRCFVAQRATLPSVARQLGRPVFSDRRDALSAPRHTCMELASPTRRT